MQSRSSTGGVAFEDLNDAEQRLYDLAKRSMPLAEVAVRLGVPIGEADRRIEALLARLQLPSRAALQDGFRPPPVPVEEDAEAALGEIPAEAAIRGSRMRTIAVLAPVVVVVAVAVFLFFRFDTSDSAQLPEAPATVAATPSTVAATASPTATATPEVIAGVEVKPLHFGQPVDFPEDVAAIIVNGCWQCDGPPSNIERVYRSKDGTLRKDILFEPPRPGTQYINTFAVSADGQRLAVGVCTTGYCGGIGEATPDAEVTLRYSNDGGITWSELGKLAIDERVVDVNDGILIGKYAVGGGPQLSMFPGRQPVPAPALATYWSPFRSTAGFVWPTADGQVVDSNGELLFRDSLGTGSQVAQYEPLGTSGLRNANPGAAALGWVVGGELYIGLVDDGRLVSAFRASPGGVYVSSGPGSRSVFASVDAVQVSDRPARGRTIAIIDLNTGDVRPVSEPLEDGRNMVVATFTGPFARIVNMEGDCLNIRESPDLAAKVIECLPDGVLLRDLGHIVDSWMDVQTPSGAVGWASVTEGAASWTELTSGTDTYLER